KPDPREAASIRRASTADSTQRYCDGGICHRHASIFASVLRALALSLFFGLLFFSLVKVSQQQPAFHVGFSEHWREMIFTPVCVTIAIGAAFVSANFSFGYFAGFYLFTMMAGYFWLNTFSALAYDHTGALT